MSRPETLTAALTNALGEQLASVKTELGEVTAVVRAQDLLRAATTLRDAPELAFEQLTDLCGVDYSIYGGTWDGARYAVVYHLLRVSEDPARLRVEARLDDGEEIDSVIGVWPAADWYEREAYDLYGILFSGHPDLRRILTDYGFDGHPLRKDFPLTGFVEVRYDEERKRVVYEPVRLPQEFRNFDYLSPWEGTDYVLPGDEKKSS